MPADIMDFTLMEILLNFQEVNSIICSTFGFISFAISACNINHAIIVLCYNFFSFPLSIVLITINFINKLSKMLYFEYLTRVGIWLLYLVPHSSKIRKILNTVLFIFKKCVISYGESVTYLNDGTSLKKGIISVSQIKRVKIVWG